MSRNDTLREVADKLPPINKVTADGKLMYDERGYPVKADHFREMVSLKNDLELKYGKPKNAAEREARHKLELDMVSNYSLGVQAMWNTIQRKKRVQIYKKILQGLSITTLAIYIWVRYF